MVFKKEKMIARIKAEGREEALEHPDVKRILEDLDGCEVEKNCWRRVVHGEPVYWVVGRNGTQEYVNEADCE